MPRLLIVDDDATTLRLMSTLLPLMGYEVTVNADPAAVLEAAHHSEPDAFVVDYHLEGLEGAASAGRPSSGLDVVRDLRADRRFATTPIIMVSGEDREEAARQAGASAFLLKPFMPDQLLAVLNSLVQ